MLRQETRKLQDTSTLLTTLRSTTKDGYVVVKVNFLCGSRQYIGQAFTTQVISGSLANMKPTSILLLSYMGRIGLPVLTPRSNRYSHPWFFFRWSEAEVCGMLDRSSLRQYALKPQSIAGKVLMRCHQVSSNHVTSRWRKLRYVK